MLSRRQQFWQVDNGRYTFNPRFSEERSSLMLREAQRTRSCFVVNQQQVIHLPKPATHRSGAKSPIAQNIGLSAAVWNGPGPSLSAGSRENREGFSSHILSYSKVALSLSLRTRPHSRPTR